MKETGIVRNIDHLGRVTLPMELRRVMGIDTGTPLEICGREDGSILIRKYKADGGLADAARKLRGALNETLQCECVICDRDRVISASDAFLGDNLFLPPLSPDLAGAMRSGWTSGNEPKRLPVLDESDARQAMFFPIYRGGEVSGCVGIVSDGDSLTDEAFTAMRLAAALLTQKLGG